ncbi:MAG TPA: hypothetical protein VMD91_17085 [Candidatus Sulfotelmatobacter sp.]|nr:hypothetical protein [Candidatus Sulfotelmatobacter sp.]
MDAETLKDEIPEQSYAGIRGRIETVRGTIVTAMRGASGTVTSTVSDAGTRVTRARDEASQRGRKMAQAVAENPLGITLGALAIGFLVGLLIPVTEIERERVGKPVRDAATQRTHAVMENAVEAAREIVRDTLQAARSSAQAHGATMARQALDGAPFAAGDVKEV